MNIHFTNRNLFDALKEATILKVVIGSKLYGLDNSLSDTDYLYIYSASIKERNSFLHSQHQLQYKENGVDHNFISIHAFIRNLLSGDSTINYEVLFSEQLKGTDLEFLYDLREQFYSYTIIRAYTGFCRRDVRFFNKEKNLIDKQKKLKHIIRGYFFTVKMMNKKFSLSDKELTKICTDIDNISDYSLLKKMVGEYSDKINILREELNTDLNKYTRYLDPIIQAILDKKITKITNKYQDKTNDLQKIDYMHLFYNAFENWVEYGV